MCDVNYKGCRGVLEGNDVEHTVHNRNIKHKPSCFGFSFIMHSSTIKMTQPPKAFSFASLSSSGRKKQADPSDVLLEHLHELFHKDFLGKVKEWNMLQDRSSEQFSEYIQLVKFLNQNKPVSHVEYNQASEGDSSVMDISLTRKRRCS